MGEAERPAERGANQMRKRRTTLEDGRYLIYYTFGESGEGVGDGATAAAATEAENEAGEERSV